MFENASHISTNNFFPIQKYNPFSEMLKLGNRKKRLLSNHEWQKCDSLLINHEFSKSINRFQKCSNLAIEEKEIIESRMKKNVTRWSIIWKIKKSIIRFQTCFLSKLEPFIFLCATGPSPSRRTFFAASLPRARPCN